VQAAIRSATPADFDSILALWQAAGFHTTNPDSQTTLNRFHAFSSDLFLVAEVDGRIVGTVLAPWNGWRAYIARLAVEPGRRRSGIATALVEEAQRRLIAKGARQFYANVDTHSPPAVPFWEAAGFRRMEDATIYAKYVSEE
jgi:ribosomal protein S18 acetylase RimI-like enzyme